MSLRRASLAVFGLCASIYLFTARGYLSSYDYYSRFLVTRSIVERGAIDIPPRVRSVEGPDGRHYAPYSLGESFAFVPFYLAGRAAAEHFDLQPVELVEQAAASCLFPLATALGVALVFAIARGGLGASRHRALALAATYALATPAWPYSKWHNEQPLETLCLLLALALLVRAPSPRALALAGWALAGAVFCRFAAFVAVPGLIWLGIARAGRVGRGFASLRLLAPLALLASGLLALNALRFGNALSLGYGELADELASPLPVGILGLLASPGRGFLFFVPTALLLPLAWRRGFARSPLARPLLAVTAGYLLLYGSFTAWYGTEAWGPRYLLPLVPLSVLPLVALRQRGVDRLLWVALAMIGAASQLPPVVASPSRYFQRLDAMVDQGQAIDPLFDPALSPLVLHWGEAIAVLGGAASAPQIEPEPGDPVAADLHRLATASPNFWWVYAAHLGIAKPLIALLVGLLALTALGSARVLRRWLLEPEDG